MFSFMNSFINNLFAKFGVTAAAKKRARRNVNLFLAQLEARQRRRYSLFKELSKQIYPLKRDYDSSGFPIADRVIHLASDVWSEHKKAGINKCLGFKIIYVDKENTND